jgi:hypothetical protein
MPKNAENYSCEKCNFICSKKSNYDKHMLTRKHKNRTILNEKMPKNAENNFVCINCNKAYKIRNSLWYHQQRCSGTPCYQVTAKSTTNDASTNDVKNLTNLVMEVVRQNNDLTSKLVEICKNGTSNYSNNTTNSHNKTFNLQFFLNETCKDAMNITEFVDSVKLQLSDLENVGKLGFIDGISNIIVKKLKSLDITQRPVHCSDSKRETMYIKDDNKWEKENEDKTKIRKVIKQIANKNTKLLKDFREKTPDYNNSDSHISDEYNKLIIEAMGGRGDNDIEKENKIIKNISKEVIIEK